MNSLLREFGKDVFLKHGIAMDTFQDRVIIGKRDLRIYSHNPYWIEDFTISRRIAYFRERLKISQQVIKLEAIRLEKTKAIEIKKIGGITFFRFGRFGGSWYLKKGDTLQNFDQAVFCFMGIVVCSAIIVSLFS